MRLVIQAWNFSGVMDSALSAGLSDPADYLQVWTVYVNYLRRRIDWAKGQVTHLLVSVIFVPVLTWLRRIPRLSVVGNGMGLKHYPRSCVSRFL